MWFLDMKSGIVILNYSRIRRESLKLDDLKVSRAADLRVGREPRGYIRKMNYKDAFYCFYI